MRRFLMMFAFCGLALAAPARADLPCAAPDLLAVVFDNGDINNTPALATPYNMHVVLLNPSHDNVDAFEFRLVLPNTGGNLFVLQETLPPGAINVGVTDYPNREYIVGLAYPRWVENNRISLVSFSLMSLAATPDQDLFVQPTTIQSIPGHIAYNVTTQEGATIYTMAPVSGSFAAPVARLFPQTPLNYCDGGPDLTNLRVDIATAAGGLQDPLARAGTAGNATDGFDDVFEMPEQTPPPGYYVCTSFEHATWPLGPRFNHDIRAVYDVNGATRTWPLMVETDRSGPVVLTFTPNFVESDNIGLFLRDMLTGETYSLFPQLSHTFQNGGLPVTRRFELTIGLQTPPALSPITRSLPAGWSLVGLPLTPPAGANTVGAVMFSGSPGITYAYTYDRAIGYVPAPSTSVATVGTGYWLGTTMPYSWTMNGTRNLNGLTMPMTQGWNLIGNPLWFTGPVEGLRVMHGGNTYQWLTAVQMGLVSPDVQGYNPAGSYYDAFNLVPWQGYWVHVIASDVSLYFYWHNFVPSTLAMAAPRPDVPATRDAWRTDLVLTDAVGNIRSVTLGVDPLATAGFDGPFDRPQPPASPQGGPTMCFRHPEWQLAAGSGFTRDLVGPTADPLSWQLTLSAPTAGVATLSWNSAGWPEDLDFQLFIPDENRVAVRSMLKQASVSVDVGPRARTVVVRTPDMTSGVGDLPGAGDCALSVHPNPFNPQATLSFTMPQAGSAEIHVYSVRGELVAVLGGQAREAGRQQLTWNGADRQGRSVPSGSYFGRLYVDGRAAGGIVRMSLVR